jgi:hypothetical protein
MKVINDFPGDEILLCGQRSMTNVRPMCSLATKQIKVLISFTHFKLPRYVNLRCITCLVFHSVLCRQRLMANRNQKLSFI